MQISVCRDPKCLVPMAVPHRFLNIMCHCHAPWSLRLPGAACKVELPSKVDRQVATWMLPDATT